MKESRRKDTLLTAAECAERIGVTVRGLRTYEQRGLLTPRRSTKGWRLYGVKEIARLHEVLALKRFGLSLSRIAALLDGRAVDLERTLGMQQSTLTEQRERIDERLALVNAARTKLSAGRTLSLDELITLAKETKMTQTSLDLIAQRRYEQARPRKMTPIDPEVYDRYVGVYRFEAVGLTITITRDEKRLFEQVTGQASYEIFPESETEFFLKVVPAQIVFSIDRNRTANALTNHQNGIELVARRIDESEVERAADELTRRIHDNRPQPDSGVAIRRAIDESQRGEIDCARMTEPLATLALERAEAIAAELAGKGELRDVRFDGVGLNGWDVYRAQFEKGATEWRIDLALDGRIRGLFFRALP
ncbi:MerR family transcriptional regulator [Methylosinus sp. H3A]|uniref:MerR family transcriptional regulator n=1 Tax=Methylosinus sp. H3A TaxID=2785786 RepID=UPI0018C23B25|nr:MerR family transcriptional regulator [Methylosinus sp. H3A]MBG0812502.1 MerR family transcriptional regulator [Methylosinus sp. H3A]